MKISLKWLNEYIDIKDYFSKPEELAKLLVSAGLEVEEIIDDSKRFEHVLVGHILEKGQHPDADRLSLCQIDVGDGTTRQIVCGAQNHKQGDKVVVTLPGAVLPGNFQIKLSKIRGVESQGMLASEVELGLAESSEGIMILPKEAPVGTPFAQYMGLDDILLELSVTPNRADCLSHLGLARELGALLGRSFEIPVADLQGRGDATEKLIQVKVENSQACPRYAGRALRGVKVGPSPAWLRKRLESVGLNSINNIVDVTNFVMMELGQPLHAFDSAQLQGGKILVRNANPEEKFTTLDGTELTLNGEELTIRDEVRPVALAGVIGGQNSGVSEATKDIFVESAFFSGEIVRRTSRKHGVETDSAQRFSRGTDPEGVLLALNRACDLMVQVAGGEVASDFIDVYPSPLKRAAISLRPSYVEERLGYSVDAEDLMMWLKRLGCQVTRLQADLMDVVAPIYRWDLTQEADLVEEYGRLQGYDKIPERFPALAGEPATLDASFVFESRVQGLMAAQGFHQAINYNFLNLDFQNKFLGDVSRMEKLGVFASSNPVRVQNPLSEELNVMRVSLLPGLFTNALHNYRHGSSEGRLFETGGTYSSTSEGFEQQTRLAALCWGGEADLWEKTKAPMVFQLKSHVENLLETLLIQSYQWRPFKTAEEAPSFLHPAQAIGLFCEGRYVGFIGSLHPEWAEEMKLRSDMALMEINLDQLGRGQPRLPKVKSIAKFPIVERDLAFVFPAPLGSASVLADIQKLGAPFVQQVKAFDVYQGPPLNEDQKSVSFRLKLQKMDGTFSEEEMKQLQDKIIQGVTKKHPVQVR